MIFMLFLWHAGAQPEIYADTVLYTTMAACERQLAAERKPGISVYCFKIRREERWEWTPSCADHRFREVWPVCRASWDRVSVRIAPSI
jgi:hypothetical protein